MCSKLLGGAFGRYSSGQVQGPGGPPGLVGVCRCGLRGGWHNDSNPCKASTLHQVLRDLYTYKFNPHNHFACDIIIPILQMGKLRHREARPFV